MKYSFLILIFVLFRTSVYCYAVQLADTIRIRKDLIKITQTPQPRQYQHPASLNQVADYIRTEFSQNTQTVTEQIYQVAGQEYRNIIASFGPLDQPRLIVGAHYDVCGDQPGADDNASGVAGILELSRLLKNQTLTYRIDLVAYTLEEPPFFRTQNMGSFVHAKSLKDLNIPVIGMVSLEMIGFFSEQRKSQHYPVSPLKIVYGSRGNYITVVQKFAGGKFSRQFNRRMRHLALLPVKTFKGPRYLPGIDFSDHVNYWQMGYSALMITDTSFYRNPHYHLPSDTLSTLNLEKMSGVINAVYQVLLHFT